MLYLCIDFPGLPLSALAPPTDIATAVFDRQGPRRFLIACCPRCASHGIAPGIAVPAAMGVYPELRLLDRSRRREAQALQSVAVWAEQFSGWLAFDAVRGVLWMEIGSSLKVFGGLDPLLDRIRDGLKAQGYTAHLGVAPTFEAAAIVARCQSAPILESQDIQVSIGRLPVRGLHLGAEVLDDFRGLGLRTIDELLALPLDGLARRLGPQLTRYLLQAIGRMPDARLAWSPPPRYQRRFELWGPVENYDGLLFPLNRIFTELEGYLRARDVVVQRLAIDFKHEKGIPPTRIELRTTKPVRDAHTLFALLRERIERQTLPAPTEVIRVAAPRLVPLGETQGALFSGEGRSDGDWSALMDRLRARLGEDAVRHLGLRDDHRPEQAWCVLPIDEKPTDPEQDPRQQRPLWLMKPRRLESLPARIGRPERIEAGWWEGEHLQRDYYISETTEGARWWLYREARSGDWFLHGLWA